MANASTAEISLDADYFTTRKYFHELLHVSDGQFRKALNIIDDAFGELLGLHDNVDARAKELDKEFYEFLGEIFDKISEAAKAVCGA